MRKIRNRIKKQTPILGRKLLSVLLIISWVFSGYPPEVFQSFSLDTKKAEAIVPAGVIVAWPGTAASIPSGWSRVTALDSYYLEGTTSTPSAIAQGTSTHTHTSPAHSHDISHNHTGTTGGSVGGTATEPGTGAIIDNHDHTITTNTYTGTNIATSSNFDQQSNDPPYTEVIWIKSNGTTDIPDGAWTLFNSDTLPSGWARKSGGRFLKGAAAAGNGGATGGSSDSHTHTDLGHTHLQNSHTHTGTTDISTSGEVTGKNGTGFSLPDHTHTISGGDTTATEQSGVGVILNGDAQPPFYTLNIIENETGGLDLPPNTIAMWDGDIGSVPTDWVVCDGADTCPNLNDYFIKGASGDGQIGTTGGALTHTHAAGAAHTHTINAHTHNFTVNLDAGGESKPFKTGATGANITHTHTLAVNDGTKTTGGATVTADANAENRPPFKEIVFIQYQADDISVTAIGTQTASMNIPSTDNYVGGAFVAIANTPGAHSITSVTITETGSVDAQADLDNIKLYYEYDTVSPYNCVDENYGGGETQYGTTDTDGFSGINGTSTFSTTVQASSTQSVCFYVVLDVGSGASNGETLYIQITDPSTEVESTSSVEPSTVVSLPGQTTLSANDMTVSATGTQALRMSIPSTNNELGGGFVFTDNSGVHTISSITIAEQGTVDGSTDLDNIELWYDLDTTAPYDCTSETFNSDEVQFGSTDTDGFDGPDGDSIFTGSVTASTTQTVCMYVVFDVTSSAQNGSTTEIEITDPSNDVNIGGGVVTPSTPVAVPGTTTMEKTVLTQIHYHWRNDDGGESTSTSATGGIEDTLLSGVAKNKTVRLRLEVSNEGLATSSATTYRLEYAKQVTSCEVAGPWTDVGAVGGDWDMSNSDNLVDGTDTTNIATSTGGVTDENDDFESPNAAVKDTSSQTSAITLGPTEFVEFEYSIEALDGAGFGDTYCFKVTNVGTDIDAYAIYPELSIRDNRDFKIQRGTVTIGTGSTTQAIYAGVDYEAPSATTTAFIRLTNTQHTGAGRTSGGGFQNADDVTVYITDPGNLLSSVNFARYGSTNDTRLSWEIVEYIGPAGGDNEMVVLDQRAVTFGSTALISTTTLGVSATDDLDVVVFVTGQANPDTGRNDYNTVLATAHWAGTTSDMVLTRGEAGGDAIDISTAVVEFIGKNWKIQRSEHTYTAAGVAQTIGIIGVNDTERAFLHVQKRVNGDPGVDEFGAEVWLSASNQVSYQLESGVSTPANHTSVAWVIENIQTSGVPMVVTRSSGTQTGGLEPATVSVPIGKTVSSMDVTSVFANNRAGGTGTAYPQPIMDVTLLDTSNYQLWISDTGQTRTYRTEIVEWPTAVRTIKQNYYQFYENNNLLDPTVPWAGLGENSAITVDDTPLVDSDVIRIRMSLLVEGSDLPANSKSFTLQYGERETTCGAIVLWHDVGEIGSTTALWRGFNATPVDGTSLSGDPPTAGDLNLSVADRAGTYEEENDTALNPFTVHSGEDVEYDWVVQNNGAPDRTVYCFQMTYSDGTLLDGHNNYPTILTAGYEVETGWWRWYDDAENVTPIDPIAGENVAANNIAEINPIKLRVTAHEFAGKDGSNVKFKLQFSESSDFSGGATDVDEAWSCGAGSLWCYTFGGGTDNATITSAVLSDADTCVAGVGNGCGSHNEYGTSTSDFIQKSGSAAEYEFTLMNNDAPTNTVYFFRLYDVTNDRVVAASSSYPSLMTHSGVLTFSVEGLGSGTTTEGIVTDATTTATGVSFGLLPFDTDIEAAQRLRGTTGAVGGYQITMFSRQALLNAYGDEIDPVTGTNAAPSPWGTGCTGLALGCFGYHAGDNELSGGSTRFQVNDTYAQFSATPEEIAWSAVPVTDEYHDVVYKIRVTEGQEAGRYETNIVHIITGVF